jgi:hypothetical protein
MFYLTHHIKPEDDSVEEGCAQKDKPAREQIKQNNLNYG